MTGQEPSHLMTNKPAKMLDLMFDIGGESLPANYPFALWAALLDLAPELAEEHRVGVLPLRAPDRAAGPLPKRTKLVLRIPATLSDELAANLSGRQLDLTDIRVRLGKGRIREIAPYSTMHAQQVAATEDEVPFMANVRSQLDEMGISCNLICGMRHTIGNDELSIRGYSLVAHDLKPDASMQLQYLGLGEARQFGCGIFVPYKVISGLHDD